MSEWTFLTSHAVVLSFLARNPHGTALEAAQAAGIRERTARKIIADLEAAGYVTKKREGRGNTHSVNPSMPLRHHAYRHVAVGHLLQTLDSHMPKLPRSPILEREGLKPWSRQRHPTAR
jgi:DNA-binding IclR family transcriptional regulator